MSEAGAGILTDEELAARGMTVAAHARRTPNQLAVISPSGNLTWRELNERANRLVRAFRKRGLQPGDGRLELAHGRRIRRRGVAEHLERCLRLVRSHALGVLRLEGEDKGEEGNQHAGDEPHVAERNIAARVVTLAEGLGTSAESLG